jgi:hypothetical protein
MPELPGIVVYLECLHPRVVGRPLVKVRYGLFSPVAAEKQRPRPSGRGLVRQGGRYGRARDRSRESGTRGGVGVAAR